MQSKSPLTDKDYEQINADLRALEQIHRDTQTALAAGFDCGPEDQLCRELKERLAKIKAAYFPERP